MKPELEAQIHEIEPSLIDFYLVSANEGFAWFANPLTRQQLDRLKELGLHFESLMGGLRGRYHISPVDSLDTSETSE